MPDDGTRRREDRGDDAGAGRRFFEAGIAEHPEDWHMLQRVFTADLDPGGWPPRIAGPGDG